MSWDVMVLRREGTPADLSKPPHDWSPGSMGEAADVRKTISAALPGVDWSDPGWGLYGGDGFSIEFNFQASGPVSSFTLHVRGGGDPLPMIVSLCRQHDWLAFDYSDGQLIDLENPSRDNGLAFQEYRGKVTAR